MKVDLSCRRCVCYSLEHPGLLGCSKYFGQFLPNASDLTTSDEGSCRWDPPVKPTLRLHTEAPLNNRRAEEHLVVSGITLLKTKSCRNEAALCSRSSTCFYKRTQNSVKTCP